MNVKNNFINVMLCLQLALLGAVTEPLRAVSLVEEDEWTYHIYFYYTGEASDETLDLWSIAVTETGARMGLGYDIHENYIRIDEPNSIPITGNYLYLKKGELIDSSHIFPISLQELNTTTLRLATQNALLGKIPAVVRRISIDIFEGMPRIWVYLDKEENSTSMDLFKASLESLQRDLPEGITLTVHYQCGPFPQKTSLSTNKGFWRIYARHENM